MRRWFLWRRDNGRYYACRHDQRRRQVERHALGTDDPDEAEALFHRFAVEREEVRDADPREVTVAQVVDRYWVHHGQHVAGADVQNRALRYCLEDFGAATVSELSPQRQQMFVQRLRERGLGDPYIKRTLGAAKAALGWAYRRGEITAIPYIITGELADSSPRQRVLDLDELRAFWRAIDSEPLARWFVLLLGTGARPGALVQLTAHQVDVLRRRIDLHPPGTTATKKRNPVVPIVPSLLPWISEPNAPTVLGRQLKALRAAWAATRMATKLGPEVVPYTFRHTLATWMDEQDVPEGQIAKWFGHGKEGTTAHWYVKRRVYRPDYLLSAANATEGLLADVLRDSSVSAQEQKSGAGDGIRTHDFNLGKVALYP